MTRPTLPADGIKPWGDLLRNAIFAVSDQADNALALANTANTTANTALNNSASNATNIATNTSAISTMQSAISALQASTLPDNAVTNAKVASNAAISADKLADGTTKVVMLATERTKLGNVASNATANDTDANLKNRANHTGTQLANTISDITEAVQDIVGPFIVAGTGITKVYDDAANTVTINATGGLDSEAVRDAIGAALVGSGYVQVVVDDPGDTITVQGSAALTSALNAKADLSSGFLSVAQLPPGSRLTIMRNTTANTWEYNGATITARPGGRNDISLDFIGGADSDRPLWGRQNGDSQKVTVTS